MDITFHGCGYSNVFFHGCGYSNMDITFVQVYILVCKFYLSNNPSIQTLGHSLSIHQHSYKCYICAHIYTCMHIFLVCTICLRMHYFFCMYIFSVDTHKRTCKTACCPETVCSCRMIKFCPSSCVYI